MNADKRRRSEPRKPINRLVAPETARLLKALAANLGSSEGRVLDRAVAALAVAESFGPEHLSVRRTMKGDTYADGSPRHRDPSPLRVVSPQPEGKVGW